MRINNKFISLRFSLSSNQFIYFQSFCFAWLQSFFQSDLTWNRSEVNPTNYPIIIKWAFPISFLSLPYGLLWSQNCLQAKSVYHIFKHRSVQYQVSLGKAALTSKRKEKSCCDAACMQNITNI